MAKTNAKMLRFRRNVNETLTLNIKIVVHLVHLVELFGSCTKDPQFESNKSPWRFYFNFFLSIV